MHLLKKTGLVCVCLLICLTGGWRPGMFIPEIRGCGRIC